MAIINPPKELREKLGDAGTDALVALINQASEKQKEDVLVFIGEKFEGKLSFLEEKFERRLAEEIAKVRIELAEVKSDLEVQIAGVRTEVAQAKSKIIKWMFIFWVGQLGVITALLFAFLR